MRTLMLLALLAALCAACADEPAPHDTGVREPGLAGDEAGWRGFGVEVRLGGG
jgi:hypothetical protein